MNKTICLMLLTCLAGACVATKEVSIPLTNAPEAHFDYRSLDSLPELPRDLSHIDYIDLPVNPLNLKSSPMYPALCMDDIDTCEMIQLERIPHIEDCQIYDIQEDQGLLFVTFSHNPNTLYAYWYPMMYAIYTRRGKLVAQLGDPIADIIEEGKDNHPSYHYEKECDNDIQYKYGYRLQLDRKRKEVSFHTERHIDVIFDYKGNYIRTDIVPPIIFHHTTRSRKVFVGFHSRNYIEHEGLLCDKDGIPNALAFKNDKKHAMNYVMTNQASDDLMVCATNSDTIWQILPTKKIARYVYTGYAKVPVGAENVKYDEDSDTYKQLWRNSWEKQNMVASDKYIFTTYHKSNSSNGRSPAYQLYDRSSGQSFFWAGIRMPHRFYLASHLLTCLPDGSIVCSESPLFLKKRLATYLESKAKSLDSYTEQDERFIRNLKLDGGPVLFFVKLKKF